MANKKRNAISAEPASKAEDAPAMDVAARMIALLAQTRPPLRVSFDEKQNLKLALASTQSPTIGEPATGEHNGTEHSFFKKPSKIQITNLKRLFDEIKERLSGEIIDVFAQFTHGSQVYYQSVTHLNNVWRDAVDNLMMEQGVNDISDQIAINSLLRHEAGILAGQVLRYVSDLLDRIRLAIEEKIDHSSNSKENRLRELEAFAKLNNGEGVANFAKGLFPELFFELASEPSQAGAIDRVMEAVDGVKLPTSAPATWKDDKRPGETPPTFIKRVYGRWLGKGLDRATVRGLDPALGVGLDNWLRKNVMPDDVDLPTAKERTAREIEDIRSRSSNGKIYDVLGDFTSREARRIEQNMRRHDKQK